jgi:hypothetical protein
MNAPGSLSAHDDLCEAFEAWRVKGTASVTEYRRLLSLAENCGMAPEEPFPLMWVRRRVETYRREVGAPPLARQAVRA